MEPDLPPARQADPGQTLTARHLPMDFRVSLPTRSVRPSIGPDGLLYVQMGNGLLGLDRAGTVRWAFPGWMNDGIPIGGLGKSVRHPTLSPRLRHRDKVRSAQFAKNHNWVVTASDDASAIVWDASTGEPLTMPLMHDRRVLFAVFADNDSAIITTDEIGNQWRWNLQPDRKTEAEASSGRSST